MATLSYNDKQEATHVEYTADDSPSAIEKAAGDAPTALVKDIDEGFDLSVVKKLTKKIDRRLIPVLSMMYAISLIDRTNLAIARAANDVHMDKELGFKPTGIDKYSIITLVFFVPYIIFELPVSSHKAGSATWLLESVRCTEPDANIRVPEWQSSEAKSNLHLQQCGGLYQSNDCQGA